MTDNEKRRQMADLLLEHVEAQKDLAHLYEKAAKMRQRLIVLQDCLVPSHPELASLERQDKSAKMRELAQNIEFKNLNFDTIAALVLEIESASNKVDQIADRKSALGL